MKKIRITGWKLLLLSLVSIAVIAIGAVVRPAGTSSASLTIHGLSPAQAHALKAKMLKGQTDADSINSRRQEGSPTSATDQYFQERAYPATDTPAAGYPNALNHFTYMNEASLSLGWQEIGGMWNPNADSWGNAAPSSVSGRASAIAVVPSSCANNSCQTIYLGTANGGIWKTNNAGQSWFPIFDHKASEAIGWLTLDPKNSNIIYAGTGEPNNSIDSNRGIGILKSTDGGSTWTTLGYNQFVNRSIAGVIVDQNNSNTLYTVSYYGRSGGAGTTYGSGTQNPYLPTTGFYRSTDGGATWTLSNPTPTLLNFGGRNGGTSLVQSTNGTLYLAIYGQGIYSSTDGGQTWTAVPLKNSGNTVMETATNFDRVTLANAPSNASVLYAAFSHGINGSGPMTFYRSADGGSTWTKQVNTPNACDVQCWYDMPVTVDSQNANTVYVGGMFNYGGCPNTYPYPAGCNTAIMKSTDGGASWSTMDSFNSGVAFHPDDHAIVTPVNGGVYSGNDGGIFHTTDGTGWQSLNNGIGTLQYQGVSVNTAGDIFGGTQDNGTFMLHNNTNISTHIQGGDGGMTAADLNNSNIAFDSYYGSQLQRFDKAANTQTWVASWWCDYFCFGGGLFYEPVALGNKTTTGASASNDLFAGTYRLWRETNGGGIDGNNDGDATNDASDTTNATPITPNVGSGISAIAVSPVNPNIVAFATQTGRIYYTNTALAPVTTDISCNPLNNAYDTSSFCNYTGGITWTRLDLNGVGAKQLPGRWVSSLTFAPGSTTKLYVTFSGFNENTPSAPGHVFVSTNVASSGTTWSNIDGTTTSTSLPDVPTNSVVVRSDGHLYVAADYGVFVSLDGGNNWYREDYGLPNAPVYQLALSPNGSQLYAATHGRGVWYAGAP